jgi:flagellar hook-associated protein 2
MDALRIGGIASGLDTNAIVDILATQAKQPVYRLEQRLNTKTLEKTVYQDIKNDLITIKNDLLNLKLESTFKSKAVSVSNPSILSATALPSAKNGSYNINVTQTAKKSYTYSQYTSASISEKGANVTSLTGKPEDFLEGEHLVNISTVNISSSDYTIAEDTFSPNNLGQIPKYSGDIITIVDEKGELTSDLIGDFTIGINSKTYTVAINASASEGINSIAKTIEDSLNAQLNSANNTSNKQYLAVRSEFDKSSGNWRFAIYDTSLENLNIEVKNDTISQSLGLSDGTNSTTTYSSTTKILKYVVSDSYSNLLTKMNSPTEGLIPKVTFSVDTSLTSGSFKVVQDASLKVAAPSHTKITGGTVSDGRGLNLSATLDAAQFAKAPSSATNGTFTINGVKITIDDYTTLTVNELLAKINSSGANVTASYDSVNDRIVLTSNSTGPENITLGDFSDTSDILSVLKLRVEDGATKKIGTDAGSIDPSAKLASAGLTKSVTSGIFTINGVSIYIDAANDSLNDVIEKVNNSGANVEMSYDIISDKVTLKSKDGIDKITVGSTNDTSSFLEAINITDDTTVTKEVGVAGQNAILNVDGINYVRSTNEISDIIAGVTLNIKNVSTENVTLNISTDPEKGIESIAKFVQHYNELVIKLNPPEIDDEDKKYLTPLTEDEKNRMSAEEVKDYEEKWVKFSTYDIISKSSELRMLKNSLRSNLLTDIAGTTGKYNNLMDIGINIAGNGDLEVIKKGMLVVDSTDYDEILDALNNNDTLKSALTDNPEDVYKLFAENSDNVKGWVHQYTDIIDRFVAYDGLISTKTNPSGTLDKQLNTISKQLDRERQRVADYLERVWKQFTYMEQQIAAMQDQGSYLSQLLANQNS